MSVTAKAEGSTRGVGAGGGVYREARQALRSLCPQALLNWREARFYLDLLHRDFVRLGLGLFYRRGGPLHLASLERCG